MISIYTGTPGSGKSLHMASKIKGVLRRRNCMVITNFEIDRNKVPNGGYLVILDTDQLTPQNIKSIARDFWETRGEKIQESRIFLFIDEAQLFFNSRTWMKNQQKGWIDFFTQHRKLGFDVILCAQFAEMIDRQVRSLIEYQFIHRKVSNFGGMGFVAGIILFFVGLLTFGKLFVAIKVWYPINQRVGVDFFIARKGLYGIYDTYKIWE